MSAVISLNTGRDMKYYEISEKNGYKLPTLIHPTAYVSPDAVIKPGCIIRTKAVISRYASLGKAVIVNIGAMIDHDCIIGDGSQLLIESVVRNNATVLPLT